MVGGSQYQWAICFVSQESKSCLLFLGEDLDRVLWAIACTLLLYSRHVASHADRHFLDQSDKHGKGWADTSLPHQARAQDPSSNHPRRSGLFSLKRSAKEVRRRCAWMIIPPSFSPLETTQLASSCTAVRTCDKKRRCMVQKKSDDIAIICLPCLPCLLSACSLSVPF